ncbi:hypothetical protein [Alloalcanivorax profundimaris]|uniref:Flp family type IVb pilin n=1 Tax=Alloalcanivorax profundimaris TaxID=2735259 RepID=A0ABS0AP26_9GAMM|nr:hypothetical protein [Alloalcanivorax profundimaris]MBM1142240.1 hypothetical protein [Alcanivorax sp. ZXX171]MCQ6262584.1 hypothetical protein [Alcanivorax sp. MM125-6]UWN49956.1 hypothetical protein ASALC70_02174 [Alcanivorax sp. ALC70]MBF1803400.1 hypothetical protein [Alloalcanivorax profundimaris]MBF5055372.1 hypothetical protein [Alloalcanivorax profundimaris]
MKAITNVQLIIQKLAARLYTAAPTRADKQRGASALEYIMLAAVIIAILVFLSTNTAVQNALRDAFADVFNTGGKAAQDAAGG